MDGNLTFLAPIVHRSDMQRPDTQRPDTQRLYTRRPDMQRPCGKLWSEMFSVPDKEWEPVHFCGDLSQGQPSHRLLLIAVPAIPN